MPLLICFCRLIILLKLRGHNFASLQAFIFNSVFTFLKTSSTQMQQKDIQHFHLTMNF